MKIEPKRLITAGGTLVCALGIGYFMQSSGQPPAGAGKANVASAAMSGVAIGATSKAQQKPVAETAQAGGSGGEPGGSLAGLTSPESEADSNPPAVELDEVILTSAAPVKPEIPALASPPVVLAAFEDPASVTDAVPGEPASPDLSCEYTLTATPDAAAMVKLNMSAPCMKNERFTLHHNGMMISEVTDESGAIEFHAPALSQNAVFIVAFVNGEGAVATVEVPSLELYDRAIVQWQGDSDLQIHAREFGADYGTDGHVWAGAARDLSAASSGAGGFITRHGAADLENALVVEAYTFPAAMMDRDGDVRLTVETEVSQGNCGRDIEAQSIQRDADGDLKTQDLVLAVPECDAIGDFLVLKNLLNDLKIAAK